MAEQQAKRDVRPWPPAEKAQAKFWRGGGVSLAEIGRRLGGRSRQSVRHMFRDEVLRERAGGSNPVGSPAAERAKRIAPSSVGNPDLALLDALMRDGGMSRHRFATLQRDGRSVQVLVGFDAPDGSPRPMGWVDGTLPENMTAEHRAHLQRLQVWWKQERLAFQLSTDPWREG